MVKDKRKSRSLVASFLGMTAALLVAWMHVSNETDILTASYGRPVALAYGRHVVGGNVILKDDGAGDRTVVLIALGEGEWDGVEQLWVNGLEVDLEASDVFHFHKGLTGQLSAPGALEPEGIGSLYPFDTDGDQKADGFTPPAIQGLTFSKTAHLALSIPFDVYSPDAEISVVGIYRCRKVRIFDAAGVQIAYRWEDNPAWQIADLLTSVRGLSDSRIDWASFDAAATYCDTLIDPLGDGSQVARFVSNVAFTEDLDFDQGLLALLSTCRGHLLDTDGTIKLRIDQARASVFDFQDHATNASPPNIMEGTFSVFYRDTRETPNRLELIFRDVNNDHAILTKIWNHQAQQTRTGRTIVALLHLGNMPQHQAERLGNYLLIRAIDNNLHCRFAGRADSLKVMPGDVVRVKHDAAPWSQQQAGAALYKDFEVLEVTDNPDETREYLCRTYSAATYPDTAGPAQSLIETDLGRSKPVPPLPPHKWWLAATLAGDFELRFAVPKNTDYRVGDLTCLIDDMRSRIYNGGEDLVGYTLLNMPGGMNPGDTEIVVNDSSIFKIGQYITIALEILNVVGPGTPGNPPTSNTIEVARAQKGTEETPAGVANDNATVRPLIERIFHFVLEPGWSLSHPTDDLASGDYRREIFRPGQLMILHAGLVLTDGRGLKSTPVEIPMTEFGSGAAPGNTIAGMLPGFLVVQGESQEVQITGELEVAEDLAAPLVLPVDRCIAMVYAYMEEAPTGADVRFRMKLNGTVIQDSLFGPTVDVEGRIPAGELGTGVFWLGEFWGNVSERELTIEILEVGAGFPGKNLTVIVRT